MCKDGVHDCVVVVCSGDVLKKEEAIQMLKDMQSGKEMREERILTRGYPAYTTAAGKTHK